MDQSKFAQLQLQIKQNNAEYQDFLGSLDSWEKDVKDKEKKLKSDETNKSNLPPVRNSLEKKKKKKKKSKPIVSELINDSNKKKIKGYDYRAWDKFDVDAACEEVDQSKTSSESEYETDEEWEHERMKLLAVQHKEQGNQHFKEGDYVHAVECYTRGIDCDPDNAVLPANRAMSLLKLEKYAAAELDCSQSLSIDATYIKAFHRRGTARAALRKYAEAKEDFIQVLKKEPKNKQAKAELDKVERLLNPPTLLQSKNLETSDVGIVKAVYKPPNQRSQKPLKRLIIEEIGEDEATEQRKARMHSIQEMQSDTKKEITAKDNAMFDRLTQEKRSTLNIKPDDEYSLLQGSNISKSSSDCNEKENSIITEKPSEKNILSEELYNKSKVCSKQPLPKNESDNVSPSESPRVPPVPSSSYQFQADWKVLKNTTETFYQYFKEIDPANFPKLFGQFLDSDVLSKIFVTMTTYYTLNNIDPFPVLLSLCDVKRFSMTVMFMSSKDKKVLQELFGNIARKGQHSQIEIDSLTEKYGL